MGSAVGGFSMKAEMRPFVDQAQSEIRFPRARRPAEENGAAFDRDLRTQNPDWGVRDLAAVTTVAARHHFAPPLITEMPANNLSLVFRAILHGDRGRPARS